MRWRTHWVLLLGSAYGGLALAQPASPAPPPSSASAGEPDAEFIEFLGADDHGDSAWWDMLKRSASTPSPASPPGSPPASPPGSPPASPPPSRPPPSPTPESGR